MSQTRRAALADALFGGISAVVMVVLMLQAQEFAPRARMFPMAVLWVLLTAALVILGAGLLRLWRAGKGPVEASEGVIRLAGVSVVLVLGGVSLIWFGFYITALVMIAAVFILHHALALGRLPPARLIVQGCVYAVAATAVMYLIFARLIGLPAPSGTFF